MSSNDNFGKSWALCYLGNICYMEVYISVLHFAFHITFLHKLLVYAYITRLVDWIET